MRKGQRPWSELALAAFLLTIFGLSSAAVMAQSAPAEKKSSSTQESKDPEAVRSELFDLLRLSPKLTTVVGADPTLLGDEAYVSRNNPELGDFLRSHPEVARNPEFYLSIPPIVRGVGGHPIFDVQRFRGPAREGPDEEKIAVFLVFVLFLAALLWIFRVVLENSKWNKLSKMQNDLYSKMLDKCGTNEELLASFRASAGKPFLDLAAIEPRSANPLNRVFLPLQLGIVLTLAGGGLLSFLYARAEDARLFLGLGTLVFMVGIGLIISAAASYFLARHLGLLPRRNKASGTNASASENAS